MSHDPPYILPRPRDSLRASNNHFEQRQFETEISGIEMLASFSVRRCLKTCDRNALYEDIGLADVMEELGATASSVVVHPGITIGKRMKSRAGKGDASRLGQALRLQRYCNGSKPIDLQVERFGVFGDFVSMVPAWDPRIDKDPGAISKFTGLKASRSNMSLISIVQSSDNAEAKRIRDELTERIETPFEVVVAEPTIFSGKRPVVVDQNGVHPATLL